VLTEWHTTSIKILLSGEQVCYVNRGDLARDALLICGQNPKAERAFIDAVLDEERTHAAHNAFEYQEILKTTDGGLIEDATARMRERSVAIVDRMLRHVDGLPLAKRTAVKEQIVAVLRRYDNIATAKLDEQVWNEFPFTTDWQRALFPEMVRQLSQLERLKDTTETSNLRHLSPERHARKIEGIQRLRKMVKEGSLGPDIERELEGVNEMLGKATSWQTRQ
jgi:hypothetical protein